MKNQELVNYIKQQLDQGVSKEEVTDKLVSKGGWDKQDVDEAFVSIFPPTPEPKPEPEIIAPQPTEIKPKKGSNKFLMVATVMISLLVIGGGAFGYFYQKQKAESPEEVFQKMLLQLNDLKSLEFEGTLQLEADTIDYSSIEDFDIIPDESTLPRKTTHSLIDFSGGIDGYNLEKPKGYLSLNISSDIEGLESPISLETRLVDQVVYLKANTIPDIGFFDLSFLADQWVRLDFEEPEESDEEIEQEELVEEEKEKLTPEEIEEIKQTILRSNALQIKERLDNQKIGEVETYHYEFSIDKINFRQLIIDLSKITGEELDEETIAELDETIGSLELMSGEIWIGKNDYLPYKITLGLKMSKSPSDDKGEVTLSLLMKNHNRPITIEAPSSSKSLNEIMEDFLAPLPDPEDSAIEIKIIEEEEELLSSLPFTGHLQDIGLKKISNLFG